jgi:FkbM family methyltransferase
VIKQAVLDFAVKSLVKGIQFVGGRKAPSIFVQLCEEIDPVISQETGSGTLAFFCPSKLCAWRVRTLLTKEPETIEWIDTFEKGKVLWDVGANVGIYSLYAALRGLTVLALEPSSVNYYILSRNIEINKMDDRVSALCVAFNDKTLSDCLYMANTEPGGALSNFGEAVDWQGKMFRPSFRQSMLGFSMDDFIERFNPPLPNYIKIDVDGIEDKIIKGAKKLFQINMSNRCL